MSSFDAHLDRLTNAHLADKYGTDADQDARNEADDKKAGLKIGLETLEEFSEWFDRETQ